MFVPVCVCACVFHCAMANGSTTNSHKRELYDNSGVLVGGRKATCKIENLPCLLCGTTNGSQYGVCYGKSCKGMPTKQFMDRQADAQIKWKAENALVPGAAPHVPVGGRRRKAAAASPKAIGNGDLAKQLKAAEARAKKAEAALKQNGNGKAPIAQPPPATDEAKALERRVNRPY